MGITDYAQDSLGDIVYIELPDTGATVGADEEITTIESVKAAEPIYSPLAGKIAQVNEELEDSPELINSKPYEAYLFAVDLDDPSSYEELMSAADYHIDKSNSRTMGRGEAPLFYSVVSYY